MKGLVSLVVISLFLISFIGAMGITGGAIDNSTGNQEQNKEANSEKGLNTYQNKEMIQEKNRLRFENKTGVQCPDDCICTGVVVKCSLPNEGREMTIYAGKSGNIIIQVKGENMTTNVTLYKSEDKIYGVFKNNETKRVRILSDQVKDKVNEKIKKHLEKESIILEEDGNYKYEGEKKSKLFGFIPIKTKVKAEINAETGEWVKINEPRWWGFLAKEEGEQIVGASCGTVTPSYNNECCKSKGYDIWDNEKSECVFLLD